MFKKDDCQLYYEGQHLKLPMGCFTAWPRVSQVCSYLKSSIALGPWTVAMGRHSWGKRRTGVYNSDRSMERLQLNAQYFV